MGVNITSQNCTYVYLTPDDINMLLAGFCVKKETCNFVFFINYGENITPWTPTVSIRINFNNDQLIELNRGKVVSVSQGNHTYFFERSKYIPAKKCTPSANVRNLTNSELINLVNLYIDLPSKNRLHCDLINELARRLEILDTSTCVCGG